MTSAAMIRRVKGLIKERVPMARRVVEWIKSPAPVDVMHSPIPRPPWVAADNLRDRFSREFITGQGIEIGALYNPVFVKAGVQVQYVDWETAQTMREQLQHIDHVKDAPLVHVDIIDDGDTLASIPANSQDFIIANHFMEHVQDPIGTIQRHLELIKSNGILFYGIPDKRFTFDKERPVTPFEHLVQDHEAGPAWSRLQHVEEYVTLVEHKTGQERETRIAELFAQTKLGIHFHVWTIHELTELFTKLRERYQLPYVIEAIVCNQPMIETLCVLRKV